MSRDQNAERIHSIDTDNGSFETVEEFQIFGNNLNKPKFYSRRNLEQTEVRECLLPFGAEFCTFVFAIQKYKDLDL